MNYSKRLNRALHARLQEKVASDYEPIQLDNAKNVVLDILKAPKHHQDHGKRYVASKLVVSSLLTRNADMQRVLSCH